MPSRRSTVHPVKGVVATARATLVVARAAAARARVVVSVAQGWRTCSAPSKGSYSPFYRRSYMPLPGRQPDGPLSGFQSHILPQIFLASHFCPFFRRDHCA